ncbi:MAG: serine kinase [Kouleothrix sp.]|nr:serine kinase [Kouleothrix sp.]
MAIPRKRTSSWRGVGSLLVRGGREIVVDPACGVEERVLRLFLLGGALGLLLHQRGLLTLHASSVAVRGAAVVFLGESGEGKSTMAAAMHARGHAVVVDDVVAIDLSGAGAPLVLPAFPQLKLWPEATSLLGDRPEALALLHPEMEKRARPARNGFLRQPLPLAAIYVLAEGPCPEIEPLRPQAAFAELLRFSYAVGLLGSTASTPAHFRQCVELAGRAPIFRLRRQRSLLALPKIAQLVEQHLGGNPETFDAIAATETY